MLLIQIFTYSYIFFWLFMRYICLSLFFDISFTLISRFKNFLLWWICSRSWCSWIILFNLYFRSFFFFWCSCVHRWFHDTSRFFVNWRFEVIIGWGRGTIFKRSCFFVKKVGYRVITTLLFLNKHYFFHIYYSNHIIYQE